MGLGWDRWDGMGWFGMGCGRVGWGGMGCGRVGRLLRLGLQDALQGDVKERSEEHLGEGAERHLRLLCRRERFHAICG